MLKNLIQTKCDQGYTFLFPTFNYSFCSNSFYHYKYSNSEVGVLGEWMLELKDSVRTNNPIFSWVVIGNKSEELLKCDNTNCFSKNTIFDYFYKKNTSYILLGCKHFTQLHYCEEIANVKWRFQKSFKGIVNFNNLNEEYEIKMFCRRLDCKSNLGFSYFDLIDKHTNKISEETHQQIECMTGVGILVQFGQEQETYLYQPVPQGPKAIYCRPFEPFL